MKYQFQKKSKKNKKKVLKMKNKIIKNKNFQLVKLERYYLTYIFVLVL